MAIETVVEGAVEEVADNLEELAEATRAINAAGVGYFVGGVCLGLGLGFYLGYRYNKEAIKAEAFKRSEEELEKLREIYEQRAIANKPKPSVEEIVQEKGYSVETTNPEHGIYMTMSQSRPLPAPVPVSPAHVVAPPVVAYDGGKSKDRDWDYSAELAKRTKEHPYVIHQDEFKNSEDDYSKVTYTYYNQDDVLCDEDDRPLPHADLIVGEENLKFGHGADDIDVVFVRNDRLEIDMEICRSPGSYEIDVLGVNDDEES